MKEIVKEVLKGIESYKKDKAKSIKFSGSGYDAVELSPSNFKDVDVSEGTIAFIDGGNCELLRAPNLSLHFIRVVGLIYEGKKRVGMEKVEFFCLVDSFRRDNEIFFRGRVFGDKVIDENDLIFSSMDDRLIIGGNRASISIVGDVARKFAEISLSMGVVDGMEDGLLVLDNSLQCCFPNENKYFDRLFFAGVERDVLISGLNKTTTLFMDNGDSVVGVLKDLSKDNKWCYNPVVRINNPLHKAEMCFVKLHEKSDYVFRYELFLGQREELQKAVGLLSSLCGDPVFLGYPAGLVMVDRLARVSNKEKEYLLAKFMMESGKDFEKIKPYVKALDAHSVLDSVS